MKTEPLRDAIAWFEIPVTDLERAKAFYEVVLDTKLAYSPNDNEDVASFPVGPDGVGGAISKREGRTPCDSGTVVYLTVQHDLQSALDRLVGAGGELITPPTDAGDVFGRVAIIKDTEGNYVGLHSLQ